MVAVSRFSPSTHVMLSVSECSLTSPSPALPVSLTSNEVPRWPPGGNKRSMAGGSPATSTESLRRNIEESSTVRKWKDLEAGMLLAIRSDTPDLNNEVGEVGKISGVESRNGGTRMILAEPSGYDDSSKIRHDSLQLVILPQRCSRRHDRVYAATISAVRINCSDSDDLKIERNSDCFKPASDTCGRFRVR